MLVRILFRFATVLPGIPFGAKAGPEKEPYRLVHSYSQPRNQHVPFFPLRRIAGTPAPVPATIGVPQG
jgi:hypothetical protein